MAKNRVIGINNSLPWRLSADLKHFKALTLGKPIIMGRKTYESIGKPLPGRTNILLTQDLQYQTAGCIVVNSPEAAIKAAGDVEEVMIIGGAHVYNLFLPKATRLYLTLIDAAIEGDAYFPLWDIAKWHEVDRKDYQPDANNPYYYSFVTLERC